MNYKAGDIITLAYTYDKNLPVTCSSYHVARWSFHSLSHGINKYMKMTDQSEARSNMESSNAILYHVLWPDIKDPNSWSA